MARFSVQQVTPQQCLPFLFDAEDASELVSLGSKPVINVLATWTLAGIFSPNNVLIGVVGCDATGGTHIHIAPKWQFHWSVRSTIPAAVQILLAHNPRLHTTIPRENAAAIKLTALCGATRTGEDENTVSFVLERRARQKRVF